MGIEALLFAFAHNIRHVRLCSDLELYKFEFSENFA